MRATTLCALGATLLFTTGVDARQPHRQKQPLPQQQLIQMGEGDFGNVLGNRRGRGGWVPQMQVAGGAGVHDPWDGRLSARSISTAIDDATLYLRSQQAAHGGIGEGSYYAGGPTGLATLALLASGADPASDDVVQKALAWLLALETNNIYVLGIRANVWEYALRKVPYEQKYRDALERDFKLLLGGINDVAWRYNTTSRDWDNSCTQYGVLGIWAAERAGFRAGDAFWEKMSKHFRKFQNKDGGWGYVANSGSSANMATAGLASMFLVFDNHHGRKGFYSAESPRTFDRGPAAEVLETIARGMQWLGKSEGDRSNSYYLYGIERTGVASGRKYIGGVDWFAEGAQVALKAQAVDGSISLGYSAPVSTALSTLFLVYGGAPVAYNKLEYGESTAWNLNPRDLANVARHLWQAYERPLNWHTVSIDDPVEEFEAPILFISGNAAPKLDEAQVAKLRAYVQRGGTILAEPGDHDASFKAGIQTLLAKMFPPAEYPHVKLAPLGADHGVFTVVKQEWRERPKMLGASDGTRTFFFLSEAYLGKEWQTNNVEHDAFAFATNLLFYATDLGALEGRFSTAVPPGGPAAKKTKLTVARVRHGAHRDWDAAASTWGRLADYAAHVTGAPVVETEPVDLRRVPAADLLHLTGRQALELSDAQRATLKRYAEGGGTVLVDAWAGSEAFARSARAQLVEVFGELRPLEADDPLAAGRFEGGADLSRGLRYKLPARKRLRRAGRSTKAQHLEVARVSGRVAVVFSPYDLSGAAADIDAFRAVGYKPDAARKVVTNVLAYLRRG